MDTIKYVRIFALVLLLQFPFYGNAQLNMNNTETRDGAHQFLVEFFDKSSNPFSIDKPSAFLSSKAIERRQKMGIPIIEQDLPVNPEYVRMLSAQQGVKVLVVSKWFNMVAVALDLNVTNAEKIMLLPNVKAVKYIGFTPNTKKKLSVDSSSNIVSMSKARSILFDGYDRSESDHTFVSPYGGALPQIQMLGGHKLHEMGFTGKGITIAVLDAGFQNVDQIEAFKHLFDEKRIIATKDFVDFDESVWEDDSHGTNVLSCMAAKLPGKIIGTAPDASYVLLRTEHAGAETRMEEISWIAGAEYADSIGADIINSSLGYTTFDQKEFNFTYQMLDGSTTLITRAADIAYTKGILVMNSAGNEGNSKWHYIGAPADAFYVVASGGVDHKMVQSVFSSNGPTSDGRIKPNICAIATNTVVVNPDGSVSPSNGTSFSNPVLSGMMACYLQATNPVSLGVVLDAVYLSSSHAQSGNVAYGWGVPNFELALAIQQAHPSFDYSKNTVWEDDYKYGFAGLVFRYYAAKNTKLKLTFQGKSTRGKFINLSSTNIALNKNQFVSSPWLVEMVQNNKDKIPTSEYRIKIKRRFKKSIYRYFEIDNPELNTQEQE